MSISFLLTIIIALCALSLAFLLFPKQAAKALLVKKRTASTPASGNPRTEIEKGQKQTAEAEAMRETVQTFVSKDPEATAKILKNWIKTK